MSWLWLGLLACSSSEQPVPEPSKKSALQTQSTRSVPAQPRKPSWGDAKPLIWAKEKDGELVSALAAQLNTTVMTWDGIRTQQTQGYINLYYLQAPQQLAPEKGEVAFILDGEWSSENIAALGWSGKAIVDVSQTMALFASPKHLDDPQLRAGVVAWQLEQYYGFPRQRLDRDIPLALYGVLATERAEAEHPSPHMRYFAASSPNDPSMVVRLATARIASDQKVIEKLARDVDPWVRARAMARMKNIEMLRLGLSDDSSLVRAVAGHQLSYLAKEGQREACDPLREAVGATDAYVRWKGAYGLGFCDALHDLIRLLDDIDIDVQRQAAQSLGRQKNLLEAQEALQKKLTSTNSFVRRWALQSLTNIHSEEMNQFLRDYVTQTSSALERITIQQVFYLRGDFDLKIEKYEPPRPPEDPKELEALLSSTDPTTLKDITKFLVLKENFQEQLYQLALHSDSEIRKSAVEGLGWNGDQRIYQFLGDTDPDVIVTALDGIRRSKIGNGDGIAPLLEHTDSEIRYRAVQAFAAIFTRLSPEQQARLEGFCADPDERIRAAALTVYPQKIKAAEPSDWVRWKIALVDAGAYSGGVVDMASLMLNGDADQQAWLRGIVAVEDEFLHRIFSWNDEKDRPPSHRVLRPPLFRDYGFPNRG